MISSHLFKASKLERTNTTNIRYIGLNKQTFKQTIDTRKKGKYKSLILV